MTYDTRACLLRQFDTACRLARLHLDTLDDDECLWRPAATGLHVQRDTDGRWQADWPEHEGYDLGPPSIAWLTWHMGFWWSMVLDHSFGAGRLERAQVAWPGGADAVRQWIHGLEGQWGERIEGLDDGALQSTQRTRWPFRERPFADIVAWVNVELVKNAAEIGYARFLYAVRPR